MICCPIQTTSVPLLTPFLLARHRHFRGPIQARLDLHQRSRRVPNSLLLDSVYGRRVLAKKGHLLLRNMMMHRILLPIMTSSLYVDKVILVSYCRLIPYPTTFEDVVESIELVFEFPAT